MVKRQGDVQWAEPETGKRHEEAAWKMTVEETEEKPLMTEDNKNWLLLLCLPSRDDNNTGAGSPSPQPPSTEGTEQQRPQHLKIELCLGTHCY